MITVYHLSSSRSERIVWLMEELGVDYRMEFHPREPNGAAPPAMKALHALGKAPVIRDDDRVLAESGAIVEYIVQKHGVEGLILCTILAAADVMMLFPFTTMRRYLDYDLSPYANIAAYLKRIEARPAYRKAMELAGPDARAA